MRQRITQALLLLSLLGLLLAACSSPSPAVETPAAVEETVVVEQEMPVQTEAPAYPAEPVQQAAATVEAYPPSAAVPAEAAYPAADLAYSGPENAYVPPARVEEPATAAPTQVVAPTAQATRQPRVEFIPTDPGTVQLAANKVQLVEFFAFW